MPHSIIANHSSFYHCQSFLILSLPTIPHFIIANHSSFYHCQSFLILSLTTIPHFIIANHSAFYHCQPFRILSLPTPLCLEIVPTPHVFIPEPSFQAKVSNKNKESSLCLWNMAVQVNQYKQLWSVYTRREIASRWRGAIVAENELQINQHCRLHTARYGTRSPGVIMTRHQIWLLYLCYRASSAISPRTL